MSTTDGKALFFAIVILSGDRAMESASEGSP